MLCESFYIYSNNNTANYGQNTEGVNRIYKNVLKKRNMMRTEYFLSCKKLPQERNTMRTEYFRNCKKVVDFKNFSCLNFRTVTNQQVSKLF